MFNEGFEDGRFFWRKFLIAFRRGGRVDSSEYRRESTRDLKNHVRFCIWIRQLLVPTIEMSPLINMSLLREIAGYDLRGENDLRLNSIDVLASKLHQLYCRI